MDNIVTLGTTTKQPLPVERILTSDTALALTEVLVIGWREDGTLHFAMSHPEMDNALMLLECAKRRIIDDVISTS